MNLRRFRGFALPTVLIASIVMLTVLVTAVSSTAGVRASLAAQYYGQLQQSASDAGTAYAKACLAANNGIPQWSDANPLKPNTDCTGTQLTGFTCPTGSVDARCSVAINDNNIIASFSVGLPTLDSNGKATGINSQGIVKLLRSSDSSIWRQYTQNSITKINPMSVSVLVVGGGGGGGMDIAGGGGGGGVVYNSSYAVTPQTYTVTVGGGGAGAPAAGTNGQPSGHMYTVEAANGGTSSFAVDTSWGSSSSKPGKSCYSLKLDGIDTSGAYWIDPDQGGANTPFQVYCDMKYDGGGWAMVLKATRGSTFNYDSSYWTTANTLNDSANDLNDADAKFRSFNEMGFKDLMSRWPDINSGNYKWVENNFNSGNVTVLTSFFSTTSNLSKGTAKDNDNWGQNIFSSQAGATFYGFNFVANSNNKVRWGYAWNNEGDWGSNDVRGGIGISGVNYSAGDNIGCCEDTTGMNRTARIELYGRNTSDTADTNVGVVALGGGAGGSSYYNYTPSAMGARGASAGGTSGLSNGSTRAGGLSLPGFGYNGGQGGGQHYSGGGGGAGGAGANSPNQPNGGPGVLNAINGTSYYWGGGGGGASYTLSTGGNGGIGGGGGGSVGTTTGGAGLNPGFPGGGGSPNCWTNTPGGNGGANTGGGGGGSGHYNSNNKGGDGGSGIVIISYPTGAFSATGGTITTVGGNTVHTFTSSSTFTVLPVISTVKVLVVGGGGGGGTGGGGGGAGGLIYNGSYAVSAQSYSITIGNGGAGTSSWGSAGSAGSLSSFGLLTAIGGGGGQHRASLPSDGAGGSGGGTAGGNNALGGLGVIGQGNNGGNSITNGTTQEEPGGGGGGAGARGFDSIIPTDTSAAAAKAALPGAGGKGLAYSISGTSTYYAGGGGGSNRNGVGAAGGLGGGGAGGTSPVAGTPNTGGGGGGTGYSGYGGGGTSAAGGSGIVIISYPSNALSATGGTISYTDSNNANPRTTVPYPGGNTIQTFNSGGNITFY